jgi:hypothetical protein
MLCAGFLSPADFLIPRRCLSCLGEFIGQTSSCRQQSRQSDEIVSCGDRVDRLPTR